MVLKIRIRKEHPLLEDEDFDFNKLYEYPVISYNYNILADFPQISSMGFINMEKHFNVDESKSRNQLLIDTNGYAVGLGPVMTRIVNDYMVSVPIPDINSLIILVYAEKESYIEELNVFKDYLISEFEKI